MAFEGAERDFFVSYTQADREWAEWIAWILEEEGYRVLIQAWDFVHGSNWRELMQAGAVEADRTIAILSTEYLTSSFGTAEWLAAWAQDEAGEYRKLLPVRVTDCDRPGFLGGVVGIDLFGVGEMKAKARLLSAVNGAVAGRVKPSSQPAFPGQGRSPSPDIQFPGAVPTIWKVPSRNPNFIGRADDLDQLARQVATESRVIVQSIRGMGGVGKTQLATEFAYLNAAQYELVWWVEAEKVATIPDQFANLADELGLEPDADPERLRAQVHRALRGMAGWLLIFDNADLVEEVRPWLPTMPLPPATRGHVIVTTRRSGFDVLGEVHEVDVLHLEAAVGLLSARVGNLDPIVAEQIAEAVGRLPLALEKTAAFLDLSQMPAAEYLDVLRTRTEATLGEGQRATQGDIITTVWTLSFERILEVNPAAIQLMDICVYLAPETIPLDLFTQHLDLLPAPLSEVAGDRLAFAEVIAALVDYSLVKRTGSNLQIHRLVQAALRSRHMLGLTAENPLGGDNPTMVTGGAASPWAIAVRLLWADTPGAVMGAPQNWPRWKQLLPHVLAATAFIEGLATGSSEQTTMHAAWLLARAANYLEVHARPSEAAPLVEQALRLAVSTQGPDDPEVGTMLSIQANVLRDLGDVAGAEPLMRRALTIAESAYGSEHPDVAARLGLLGRILRDLGDSAGAKPLMQEALRITETACGPDDHSVAIRLSSLAGIMRDLDEMAEARLLMERALTIDENALGPDHSETARRLNNLALILRDLDEAAEAKPLIERAVRIKEATFGGDHPEVGSSLSGLALILQDLGDLTGAKSLMERALQIRKEIYGPDHTKVASSLSKLALILRDLDDRRAAKLLMEQALEIQERTYGPDHHTVTTLQDNLAAIADVEDDDE